MKIAFTRVYCPHCQKLVRVSEQTVSSHTHITCKQCGRQLYEWNGIRWKPGGELVNVNNALPASGRPATPKKT